MRLIYTIMFMDIATYFYKLIQNSKYSSPIIGKAIAKLKNKFPNLIDIKNTNRGKIYTLPIYIIYFFKNKKMYWVRVFYKQHILILYIIYIIKLKLCQQIFVKI